MIRVGPRDAPTVARKAHDKPTPTSGGLGIASGFVAGLVSAVLGDGASSAEGERDLVMLAEIAASALALGFLDDVFDLPAALRLPLLALLSLTGAFSLGVVSTLPLLTAHINLPYVLGLLGTALWIFTLVNGVNFMDGANGLAMGSMLIGLLALCAMAIARDEPVVIAATVSCASALFGFLMWNFPDGRLFAGDSGALFTGTVAACASLMLITRTGLSPLIPPIVFFPLLADVLLTLLWRARRGRSLLTAHDEHVYQVARRAWSNPRRIAAVYWVAMALCGAIAFLVARQSYPGAGWIAIACLAGASALISASVRRRAANRLTQ